MLQTVGAPLHLEHKQGLIAALPNRFYELYGLTEGFMPVLDKCDVERKMASVDVPDDKWGKTLVGAVVLKPGTEASAEDIRAWVNARVEAKFQRLSDVVILDDMPRNVAGKTLKRDIKGALSRRGLGRTLQKRS